MVRVLKSIAGLLLILLFVLSPIFAQDMNFEAKEYNYTYDIQNDESTKCTWSPSIVPLKTSFFYSYNFNGGATQDYEINDSLNQIIQPDVMDQNGQRTVTILLAGFRTGDPYRFNFSFAWDGLIERNGVRHTLYTSVDTGVPQAAKLTVLLPEGAKLGPSMVTTNGMTEPFKNQFVRGRYVLTWETAFTGNDTVIPFRVNYNYYDSRLYLIDNLPYILLSVLILILGALLLGYRKRLPGMRSKLKELSSKIKEHI